MNLGPGIASSPQSYPRQGVRAREVRTSIREAREARARPETIIETDNENDAPYPDGGNAADMEAAVASLVYDSHADDIVSGNSNLTNWIDFVSPVPANAVRVGRGKLMFDATIDQIKSVIDRGGVDDKTHATLLAVQAGFNDSAAQFGLRADSVGAPETYAEAMSRGMPWPAAIDKEFGNHSSNESWHLIDKSAVPRGRRLHKFVCGCSSRSATARPRRAYACKGAH